MNCMVRKKENRVEREQGRAEMADKVIRNLLKDGVSVELVSKWTGVPINQIKSFKF